MVLGTGCSSLGATRVQPVERHETSALEGALVGERATLFLRYRGRREGRIEAVTADALYWRSAEGDPLRSVSLHEVDAVEVSDRHLLAALRDGGRAALLGGALTGGTLLLGRYLVNRKDSGFSEELSEALLAGFVFVVVTGYAAVTTIFAFGYGLERGNRIRYEFGDASAATGPPPDP